MREKERQMQRDRKMDRARVKKIDRKHLCVEAIALRLARLQTSLFTSQTLEK